MNTVNIDVEIYTISSPPLHTIYFLLFAALRRRTGEFLIIGLSTCFPCSHQELPEEILHRGILHSSPPPPTISIQGKYSEQNQQQPCAVSFSSTRQLQSTTIAAAAERLSTPTPSLLLLLSIIHHQHHLLLFNNNTVIKQEHHPYHLHQNQPNPQKYGRP